MKRYLKIFLSLIVVILFLSSTSSYLFAKRGGSYSTGKKSGYSYKIKTPRLSVKSYSGTKKYSAKSYSNSFKSSGSSGYSLPKLNDNYYKSSGLPKERSSGEKHKFLKQQGYKDVPGGYEVDHIVPLSEGGSDNPSNMQLLPKSVHKLKTDNERKVYDWNKK